MKTDLNTLKKELSKLANVTYLKKELNRIAGEIRRFDVHLNPQAKEKLQQLEGRFQVVVKALADLQKQVDAKVEKIVAMVRSKTASRGKTTAKSASRATQKKTTSKKTSAKKATKTSRKKPASK